MKLLYATWLASLHWNITPCVASCVHAIVYFSNVFGSGQSSLSWKTRFYPKDFHFKSFWHQALTNITLFISASLIAFYWKTLPSPHFIRLTGIACGCSPGKCVTLDGFWRFTHLCQCAVCWAMARFRLEIRASDPLAARFTVFQNLQKLLRDCWGWREPRKGSCAFV